MQSIYDDVNKLGYHPFAVPLGLKRNTADPVESKCIRCDTCDGYPCLVHAKPRLRHQLYPPDHASPQCHTSYSRKSNAYRYKFDWHDRHRGRSPTQRPCQRPTRACDLLRRHHRRLLWAINSAALLLQSATDKHPRGLANNSSDMVGRHFMYHQADAILSLSFDRNDDSYMKTRGTNDFYFRDPNGEYDFPMGSVQPIGSFHHEMMKGDAPPLTPGFVLETMRDHAVPWWLMTEDLPDPDNRVTLTTCADGTPQIKLSYTDNKVESFTRLKDRRIDVLKEAGHADNSVPFHGYFKKRIPLEGVGHQNGTCRFGTDPGSRSSTSIARPTTSITST
jgi:hypothetical protein